MENKRDSVAADSIKSMKEIFTIAVKGAPWQAKMILAAVFIMFFLLITSSALPFQLKPEYRLISIVSALIIALIVALYAINIFRKILERSSSEIIWSREYINIQKADVEFQEIGKDLEDMRKTVVAIIKTETGNSFNMDNIRASVFLPAWGDSDSGDGYTFRLHIPTPLRCNMNRKQEWGIRFRPGQGCAGICFIEGMRRVTRQKDFMIDDEFKESIHPDLKWIISLPLMKESRESKYAFAVLNIDGLSQELPQSQLEKIADKCISETSTIQKKFNKLPVTKLTIQATPI